MMKMMSLIMKFPGSNHKTIYTATPIILYARYAKSPAD